MEVVSLQDSRIAVASESHPKVRTANAQARIDHVLEIIDRAIFGVGLEPQC